MNEPGNTHTTDALAEEVPPVAQTLRVLFLTLFLRGRSARGLQKESAPKSVAKKLLGTLLIYALFGCLAIFLARQPIYILSAYMHSMTFVFLGMFIASSAGEVLFNREEADILLHRPILAQALLWAKIRVLVEVSLWLAGAFNLVGFFVGITAPDGGWRYPLVHLFSTVLMAFFCVASVVLVYQLCLRWFGREWLDSVMTTAQVILSVGAVLAGQLVPQLLIRVDDLGVTVSDSWWPLLFPPAWFAGIDNLLAGTPNPRSWVGAFLAVFVTGIVLRIAFGKLAEDYHVGMQTLSETKSTLGKHRKNRRWLDRLTEVAPLKWCLRDPVARASFLLTAAYLVRDRDVKLRVYPGLGPFLIFPALMVFQSFQRRGGEDGGFMFVLACSYVAMIPLIALNMLQFSQNWQAIDLFRVAPIPGPGRISNGARFAVTCLVALPLIVVLGITAGFIGGAETKWLLFLPALMTMPIFAMIPQASGGGVPLSQPAEAAKSTGQGLSMMGAMFASMAISGLAFLVDAAGWLWLFLAIEAIVVLALYVKLRRSIENAKWPSLE